MLTNWSQSELRFGRYPGTRTAWALLASLFAFHALNVHGSVQATEVPKDFAHEIVPVLRTYCLKCHVGNDLEGGLSINSLEDILQGGDSGPALIAGNSEDSLLFQRMASHDESLRMPPEGERVPQAKIDAFKKWIDDGAQWDEGFEFLKPEYEPPLQLKDIELPAAIDGRSNPIDRIIDNALASRGVELIPIADDSTFHRRLHLDLVGLLPDAEQVQSFVKDSAPEKRDQLIQLLLEDDVAYAEHWLSFWNDLLRNDYDGTGFITGGRKQITTWLYTALLENKPYDQFVSELIAPPTDASRGFIDGIKWRGEVSAGQTVEIQFAQNVSQAFLGINLKCASCHDSFIDKWKLADAYGLAAIYAQEPLEMYRCDVATGEKATPSWLFPEIGQVSTTASQPERLKELAALMTHPSNGRLARTIVNRLWHRMMGYGIVHPTDAMQSKPWSEDLLEYLAKDLVENGYDLKSTLKLIAASKAYQSQSEVQKSEMRGEYNYAGPRTKRMTAEQFVDSLWQLTGTAPLKIDANVVRSKDSQSSSVTNQDWSGRWIWGSDNSELPVAGEKLAFRRRFLINESQKGFGVVSCDNAFTLFIDGKLIGKGDNWQKPETFVLDSLERGEHEILIVAENQGAAPNPAGLNAQFVIGSGSEKTVIASDESWEWSATLPNANGEYGAVDASTEPQWSSAELVKAAQVWDGNRGALEQSLKQMTSVSDRMVRASLLKNDPLMLVLGRPNRDQIVSMRPSDLSMLEALELENGSQLANILREGAKRLAAQDWEGTSDFVTWAYWQSLSRAPTEKEMQIANEFLADQLSPRSVEDLLWAIIMLPEYQTVR